jgi:hypothetical protein
MQIVTHALVGDRLVRSPVSSEDEKSNFDMTKRMINRQRKTGNKSHRKPRKVREIESGKEREIERASKNFQDSHRSHANDRYDRLLIKS